MNSKLKPRVWRFAPEATEKPVRGPFGFMRRGGARKGAGRKAAKRNGKRLLSTHTKRERFSKS